MGATGPQLFAPTQDADLDRRILGDDQLRQVMVASVGPLDLVVVEATTPMVTRLEAVIDWVRAEMTAARW